MLDLYQTIQRECGRETTESREYWIEKHSSSSYRIKKERCVRLTVAGHHIRERTLRICIRRAAEALHLTSAD